MLDGICKGICNGEHFQLGMPLFGRGVDRVGRDDFADFGDSSQSVQAAAGEDAVRAHDQDVFHAFFDQQSAEFQDRAAGGDLVVVDQRAFMPAHLVLPTSPLMRTSLSEMRSLFPAATGRPRLWAKRAADLACPISGETMMVSLKSRRPGIRGKRGGC